MNNIVVRNIMVKIPEYFNPEGTEGITAVVQCSFTGKQKSEWIIVIRDQVCHVKEGKADDPDITIRTDGETGVKLLTGKMNPKRAFLLGKVKISGNMPLGLKLVNCFNRP